MQSISTVITDNFERVCADTSSSDILLTIKERVQGSSKKSIEQLLRIRLAKLFISQVEWGENIANTNSAKHQRVFIWYNKEAFSFLKKYRSTDTEDQSSFKTYWKEECISGGFFKNLFVDCLLLLVLVILSRIFSLQGNEKVATPLWVKKSSSGKLSVTNNDTWNLIYPARDRITITPDIYVLWWGGFWSSVSELNFFLKFCFTAILLRSDEPLLFSISFSYSNHCKIEICWGALVLLLS